MKDVTDTFRVLRVQPKHFGDVSKKFVPLVEITTDASGQLEIHCRSGLAAAVRGYLLLRGVEFHGVHPAPKPRCFQRGLGSRNPQVLEFLNSVERGRVLVHRRECGFAAAVAEIVNGSPGSKIVVIVDKKAPEFGKELQGRTYRRIDLAAEQNFDPDGANVVVSTWESLGRTGLQRADRVLVVDPLVTDKHDLMFARYSSPQDVANYCHKLEKMGDVPGKLIAIIGENENYSPLESARLTQVFGGDSVRVLSDNTDPKKLAYPRNVSVLWGQIRCVKGAGITNDPLHLKRAAVWTNPIHTRWLAKLAKALAAGNFAKIGNFLKRIPKEWAEGKPLRVVVYVESLDHAEFLAKKLGFPIVSARSEIPVGNSGVIATEMGAGALDGTAVDVVIRADLGVGLPRIIKEWTSSPRPCTAPLYVVDFNARDSALLRKWTQSRRDAYLDTDWPDFVVDPDIHAYRMFHRGVMRRDRRGGPAGGSHSSGASENSSNTQYRFHSSVQRDYQRQAHRKLHGAPTATTGTVEVPEPVKCPTLEDIADVGFLLRVFHDRTKWSGRAPGRDGIRWGDMGRSEAARIFRKVSRKILNGTYRPAKERRVMMPRPGKKPRPLDIGSVIDRVVAAAAALLLNKYYETLFHWSSYAYREERGHLNMLAMIAVIAEKEGRWVIGNHDISQAFVNIPLGAVMDAHRAVIQDTNLLQLIEALVYGAEGTGKERGLSQGAPYSPVAMNLYMHTILDSVYERDLNDPPLLRFSDNLVPLSRSVADSLGTRARCQGLLDPYGLTLKDEADPEERIHADLLAGESTRLLGFTLGYQHGRMTFGLDAKWWGNLSSSLHKCHQYPDPHRRAFHVIDGWILATGPAATRWQVDSYVSRTLDTLCFTGFRETNPETVQALWEKSSKLWAKTLLDALQDYPLVRRASATANAPGNPL